MLQSWGFLIARQYNYQFKNFYAVIIQRAYRDYKKRPESLAKRVWEVMRSNGTPDKWKYLGIIPRDEGYYYINGELIESNYVTYLATFRVLYQQGYIVVRGTAWYNILKWLQNPKFYLIDKKYNFETV
ncbi:hypothetical protein C1645_821398 [Glomus cerebriforme]|uniref:Uncharacterized protein n=1 Tax=Glomus cerebriforme TaxID=658196 RepID=A0A397TAJ1_9GLOM|nr:hypothetical protein C1645_821398 [Glomus cerebriforme]